MNENNEINKNAIITIGNCHYILPIISYEQIQGSNITKITLKDGSKLETSNNNIILLIGESDFINAVLENPEEKFYQPNQTKHGKTMIKRITKEGPFRGNKNE